MVPNAEEVLRAIVESTSASLSGARSATVPEHEEAVEPMLEYASDEDNVGDETEEEEDRDESSGSDEGETSNGRRRKQMPGDAGRRTLAKLLGEQVTARFLRDRNMSARVPATGARTPLTAKLKLRAASRTSDCA